MNIEDLITDYWFAPALYVIFILIVVLMAAIHDRHMHEEYAKRVKEQELEEEDLPVAENSLPEFAASQLDDSVVDKESCLRQESSPASVAGAEGDVFPNSGDV